MWRNLSNLQGLEEDNFLSKKKNRRLLSTSLYLRLKRLETTFLKMGASSRTLMKRKKSSQTTRKRKMKTKRWTKMATSEEEVKLDATTNWAKAGA